MGNVSDKFSKPFEKRRIVEIKDLHDLSPERALALEISKLRHKLEILEKTSEWYQELLEYILASTSDEEVRQLLQMIKLTNGDIL